MAIPDFQSIMAPLLKNCSDAGPHALIDLRSALAAYFHLTGAELGERLQNGTPVFANRIDWAVTHLAKAGMIERVRRGVIRITDRGRRLLAGRPDRITMRQLTEFPEYREFRKLQKPLAAQGATVAAGHADGARLTPEESLAASYAVLRNTLATDLLDAVKKASPAFFERLVVDLLVAMGYGGSVEDAGRAVGGTGDDGIDGVIKEDKLGLDAVYVQAKRWTNVVGRPAVQAFAGSLEGVRARKGVLITTSDFSQDARDYVQRIEKRIVPIDGRQLAQYMIDHGVGVTTERSYVVKRIDQDHFERE
jgi:restriction system protein